MPTSRREFLIQTCLGGAALAGRRALAGPEPTARRPNILFFITDDQSWLDCGAYGNDRIRTPNFDRVARDGVRFNHCYVSSPSCTPSRAATLTGRNHWELGTGSLLHGALPKELPVYPDLLEAAGYAVGCTGKGWGPGDYAESGRPRNPAGPIFNRLRVDPPLPKEFSPIDYAANVEAFLKQKQADQPFCLWVGTFEPHHPHNANNYRKLPYTDSELTVPAFLPPLPGVQRERANYFSEIEYADQQLGRILDHLEQTGELDNTLVIVTGDNGTPLPRAKSNLYDWGTRVPCAAMWRGQVEPGRVSDDFVSFIDFAPTFLQAAGLEAPQSMSGRSLVDVLTAKGSGIADPPREFVATGLEWHDNRYPMRAIRTREHLYIRNYDSGPRRPSEIDRQRDAERYVKDRETLGCGGLMRFYVDQPEIHPYWELCFGPRPGEELYDCVADPDQFHNLAADPAQAATRDKLAARLDAYLQQTGDPRATGHPEILEDAIAIVESKRGK